MDRRRGFDDPSRALAESDASIHAAQCTGLCVWRFLRAGAILGGFSGILGNLLGGAVAPSRASRS